MPQAEVEALLVEMILDRRLSATIDQVNGCILLNRHQPSASDMEIEKIVRLAEVLSVASAKLCVGSS